MKKYIIALAVILMVAGLIQPMLSLALAQGTVETVKKASGNVVSVSNEDSTIDVSCLTDALKKTYEQKTFSVSDKTTITKNGEATDLYDVVAGDKVSLVYSTTAEGENIISSMVVGK
ncbi:MAG: hypothetical protein KJ893_00740 [Candidatus Omnitrophica bacterium]|nr:hypothetical protein [Candidatus Omnitrophota bacterium]MBU4479558.1 hypothetical protein [Candidatus Omnitrophota bacterium]MCG2704419.1 hypothetical protein [Candidatus Omnitrophota bacterium]